MAEYDLSERTALVTGAGRGNGKASAELLAASGASVVVNDLEEGVAEATAAGIREDGGEAIAVGADVSDEAEVEAMVGHAADEFGGVDVVVNNAGVGKVEAFAEKPGDELFDLNLDTHLMGAVYCTKHALDGMREQGYGKVINLTSIHTKNGVGLSPQYDVGKYSLLGLTKSLALELGPYGIRVNAVAPGWVNTRMTETFTERTREQITGLNPLGRFAESGDIGEAVTFLAAPASDYVNGHEFRVDGGQQPIDRFKYESDMSEKH